jgi:hypothetical protein
MLSIAMLIFLILFFIFCQYSLYAARRKLTLEQKGILLDVLTKSRIVTVLALFSGLALIFLFVTIVHLFLVIIIYSIAVMIAQEVFIFKKITKEKLPEAYQYDRIIFNAGVFVSLTAICIILMKTEITEIPPQPITMSLSSDAPLPTTSPGANPCSEVARQIYQYSHERHGISEDNTRNWKDIEWMKKNVGAPQVSTGARNVTSYKWVCPVSDSEINISKSSSDKSEEQNYFGQYCVNGKCDMYMYGEFQSK